MRLFSPLFWLFLHRLPVHSVSRCSIAVHRLSFHHIQSPSNPSPPLSSSPEYTTLTPSHTPKSITLSRYFHLRSLSL
ncbi:hypothetical protein ASPBRDRAFT_43028 [Aspergillus brasiliensis CBS 101740]|uniref:Secreted protein n=1 Tax=Aspergillus brasiliensis (strain CBS 101740 / IMI 381727 / IBT 21946) TaxID=767769 RepID=A0A1L9UIW3_ASPBC|nr:hypothetical protein ASPBRDRAFT_43028 [Aspergillus brasiliensis CBS 101740]